MDYRDRIIMDPEIRFGRPVIKGTRIGVSDILGYLAAGEGISDILGEFPQLTNDDILACFAFVAERESLIRAA